ncbi:cell surface protein, partial [Akkermansia sp. GGCC_0220]|nr:cell surface protein [Akkermansia sp. GGCC_0220]
LLDDPNFKPDEAEIVSYFHQYVNELRALNGQSALTLSERDTSRAQQRVRAIVEDFNHEAVSHATENIGTNTG